MSGVEEKLTNAEWATFPVQPPNWATPTPEQRDWVDKILADRAAARNHHELLIKYIRYVRASEGTDCIQYGFDGFLGERSEFFTDVEWAELERLREETDGGQET